MLLTELWDEVAKQRDDATNKTASKPLTAKERMDQRNLERKEAIEKRKAELQKRSTHFGKSKEEESSDE